MVEQKDLNLHQPLDSNADATIRRVPLEPQLATAALTLHGDYYRQLQTRSNRYIVWHPVAQGFIFAVLAAFSIYAYRDLILVSESVGEFFSLALRNKFILTTYFPILIFIAGVLGSASFMITDEFRAVSDGLAGETYRLRLFRFPLTIYANSLEKDREDQKSLAFLDSASESTDLIEYRGSPIAVVTVIPVPDRSTNDVFYARITGLHVRKVYRGVGIEDDLLEYATEKARSLCARYVKDNKIKNRSIKTVIIADAYTCDPLMTELYLKSGFQVVKKSFAIDPFYPEKKVDNLFKLLPVAVPMKFFGIARLTYERQLDSSIEPIPASKPASETIKKRKN